MGRQGTALFALAVLVLAVTACGASGAEPTATMPAAMAIESQSATPRQTVISDWDEFDGFALQALAVEDPARAKGEPHAPEPGAKLVAVEFVLANLSGSRALMHPSLFELLDAEGQSYATVRGWMAEHEDAQEESIGPGQKMGGWVCFKVPEAMTPTHLRFEPPWWLEMFLQVELTR